MVHPSSAAAGTQTAPRSSLHPVTRPARSGICTPIRLWPWLRWAWRVQHVMGVEGGHVMGVEGAACDGRGGCSM